MINAQTASARGRRHRRAFAATILAAAGVAAIGLPGTALANDTAICSGSLKKTNVDPFGPGLAYSFSCEPSNVDASGEVKAYAISVNRRVDYFSPETVGYDENGDPSGEAFSCQGSFPSWGFGCSLGTLAVGHTMTGTFATERGRCELFHGTRLAAWVSVTTVQTNHLTSTTYTDQSEPYRLRGPDCSSKRHRRHRGRR